MNEVFEFSNAEVSKILFQELLRQGKTFPHLPETVSVRTEFKFSRSGNFENVQVKVGPPKPDVRNY